MYNKLLDNVEEVIRQQKAHHLIIKGAEAGFNKLSSYYDKASPIIMAATFMDPRCKLHYFVSAGWRVAGEIDDSYAGTDENLIVTRVRPP